MALPVPSELAGTGFLSLFEKNQGGLFVLYGDQAANSLAQKLLVFPLSWNQEVMILDAGNVFDPYLITRMAQALGREPKELLSKILISRSFTCHQTQALGEKVAMRNGDSRPFILVLGILSTFYDEAISLGERRALLKKTLNLLKGISEKGGRVLIASADAPEKIQNRLDSLLIQSADRAARVEQNPDGGLSISQAERRNASPGLRRP